MQINFERLPTLNYFLHRVKAYLNKRPRFFQEYNQVYAMYEISLFAKSGSRI